MSYHISRWATTSPEELQHLKKSYPISRRATTSPEEQPHLHMSYHISRRATTSPEEQPHLQMSYHISRWATTFFRWATIAFDKTLMWIDAQVLREFILMTCTEFGKSLLLFISWKILFFFIIHSRSGLVFWESIKKTAPFIIKKCRGKKTATLF